MDVNGIYGRGSGSEVFGHEFDDLDELIRRFDSTDRDEWQMPEKVISALELEPSATVMELGAGTGYFAVRLAMHLQQGKVIATDKQAKLVSHIQGRARELGLVNLDARRPETGLDVCDLERGDLILSVDSYHHIPDRVALFSNIAQHLKTDGRVAIIDRKIDSPGSNGFNRVSPEAVKDEMHDAGFELTEALDFLPYQYFLIFSRECEAKAS